MPEYFIRARSFAAPFMSDESTTYLDAATASRALELFAAAYQHPAGLYAAKAYESADAYHKGRAFLAQWLCNHEQEKRRTAHPAGGYSYLGYAPGDFEVNGERHRVDDPKSGRVVRQNLAG